MKKESILNQFPYFPKIWATITYLFLFIGAIVLFMGRNVDILRIQFLNTYFPDPYKHISNFSLSFIICLGVGYMTILKTKSIKGALLFGILLVLLNFVYETFIPILNTPDKIDAYFGYAGTILPFIFFIFYLKFGLISNMEFNQNKDISN